MCFIELHRKNHVLASLTIVLASGALLAYGREAPACRRLDVDRLSSVIGGACANTKCQNLCQTTQDCGDCPENQSEGERCPGGGGGTGIAFVCITVSGQNECQLGIDDSGCDPTKICRCDAETPPTCKEFAAPRFNGKRDCVTGRCSE
jgi:hypothetical protein